MGISVRYENAVAVVSICRPEALNALNRDLIDQLDACISEIESRRAVKSVIRHGSKNFAAGADIAQMADCNPEGAKAFAFSPVYNRLARLSIPTIAAIEGYALGGGLELALACDLRICGESAKLGFPEIGLGIMPGAGGTIRAPRLIGSAKAMEMIFTGSSLSAADAERIGLVNRVVPDGDVLTVAMEMAMKIAKKSRAALEVAKHSILAGMEMTSVTEAVAMEAENWSGMFATYDQKEGMHAFLEKRKPSFADR